ncbi:pyrrolo-quinoline quinone : Pyrrolo-quinoline quinone OS=Chthoniobacter flavus Ellin428 GN=CfE428DRAFT_1721 PE=4 SV=1: PQQ_2 [Gemmata massiliana]|uniref:EF-hand domain-containing protein n=1 Tax=Gemmata massiliana TaxID=1210884 RepID=A0A6P2D4P2_9BACT|nr:PQQ-binding-like beta-propeller repeat protein [Gemmata massiliana]VTR94432.1 pyrrolo-quinoline quinone : Pyrrolo-quinoline quinone OS=Chthoniobacter flavus Ellin428 GN=CfE428DRAFT_1721 PE=4 SV=1: PQQ_2 [Gemmata massiliana]
MKKLIAILALGLSAGAGMSADPALAWPQFRGPNGSGIAEGQKPPVEFGPNKNVKWKVAVPSGFSSPIVAGDNLVLTAFEDGKLYTIAYNRATGKEAWRAEAPAKQIEPFHKTEGSPAASTPVTDGTRIISYFGSCGVFCYNLSGKELWRHEMPTVSTPFDFGTGVSPILADGVVVLVRDENKDPKILTIDAATGTLIWVKKRESKSAFCTPVVSDTPAGKQIIVPGYGRMIGYDFKTGDEKWTVIGMPAAACTTPVVADGTLFFAGWAPGDDVKLPSFDALLKESGDEKLGYITRDGLEKTPLKGFFDNQDFDHDGKLTRAEWDEALRIVSASKNSAFALKLGGSGDVTKSHVLWKQTKGLPYVPSGIVCEGQFVLVKDGGLVTAYDTKTGKAIYEQERAVANGRYYSSPVAANGHIYFACLDNGAITVLKAGADDPEVVARNPKLNERVAATPVIADNALYVRTAGFLYAFAEKKK